MIGSESNPVRAVDVFVDALELRDLGFDDCEGRATAPSGADPDRRLEQVADARDDADRIVPLGAGPPHPKGAHQSPRASSISEGMPDHNGIMRPHLGRIGTLALA